MINWLTEQDRKDRKLALMIISIVGILGISCYLIWFYLGLGLY